MIYAVFGIFITVTEKVTNLVKTMKGVIAIPASEGVLGVVPGVVLGAAAGGGAAKPPSKTLLVTIVDASGFRQMNASEGSMLNAPPPKAGDECAIA